MKEIRDQSISRVSEIRKRHKVRIVGKTMEQIDWTQVASGFLEGVTTASPEWKHMAEALSRNPNDRERRALVVKLGDEMTRLYVRYRKAAERREGNSFAAHNYRSSHGDTLIARKVIQTCILKGVHPVKLLEFWDKRVSSFTDLKFPTLVFLQWSGAVDQAAAAGEPKAKRKAPKGNNSFADVDGLDPKLRPALEAAGFATQSFNDRYLLTIQMQAKQLAKGRQFFLPPGEKKRMIKFAAKELYGED